MKQPQEWLEVPVRTTTGGLRGIVVDGTLDLYQDRVRFRTLGPMPKESHRAKIAERAGNPELNTQLELEGWVSIFDAPLTDAPIEFPWSKRNAEVRVTVGVDQWKFEFVKQRTTWAGDGFGAGAANLGAGVRQLVEGKQSADAIRAWLTAAGVPH